VLIAKKAKTEELARQEQERIAEETRVKQAEHEAEVAGFKEQVARIQEEMRRARLEADFKRDLPDIKSHLAAFITSGHQLRRDYSNGPVSLAYLKSEGALNEDREGMEKLLRLAGRGNDRPRGALPKHDLGWANTPKQPVEKAQALLKKYGDLLVEKGMLDR
jgi:hypothetical protein